MYAIRSYYEQFDTELTVVDMFKYPTIRSLCEFLENTAARADEAAVGEQMKTNKEAMKANRKRLKEIIKK